MSQDKEIIMYDSPEAAKEITLTGWASGGTQQFFYRDEHLARWAGCTHLKCDCGNIMEKSYTKCSECRIKSATERYNAMPYKEYETDMPVCERGGDKYFFTEDDIIEHLSQHNEDNPDDIEMEIDLVVCDPVHYYPITSEAVTGDAHEDYEPPEELEQKIDEFNKFIQTLSPHSWTPGKVRTSYKMSPQ